MAQWAVSMLHCSDLGLALKMAVLAVPPQLITYLKPPLWGGPALQWDWTCQPPTGMCCPLNHPCSRVSSGLCGLARMMKNGSGWKPLGCLHPGCVWTRSGVGGHHESTLQILVVELLVLSCSHAQSLAALQAYSHWLAQFYSEVQRQNPDQFVSLISTTMEATAPLISSKVCQQLH